MAEYRVMYDGVTPTALPSGGQLYGGYIDGAYGPKSYDGNVARHPDALHVSISNHYNLNADVLDWGEGAATDPVAMVQWVARVRAAKGIPTVYLNHSQWAAAINELHHYNVAQPLWWVADWTGEPHLLPGTVATQWRGNVAPGYDQSSVAAYWPGIDQPPAPPTPPVTTIPKDIDMMVIRQGTTGAPVEVGTETVIGALYSPVHLTDAADVVAVVNAIKTGNYANLTYPGYAAMIAAATPAGVS